MRKSAKNSGVKAAEAWSFTSTTLIEILCNAETRK
jgi:hypothetical protein